jgi:DNA polymerase III epsilon subunit-like protein
MKKYNIVKNEDDLPWAPHIQLDTMDMFFVLFENDPAIKNFKLDTMASTLGMQRSGSTHDAVEDVAITTQAFRRQMLYFRECRKRMSIRGTKNDSPR